MWIVYLKMCQKVKQDLVHCDDVCPIIIFYSNTLKILIFQMKLTDVYMLYQTQIEKNKFYCHNDPNLGSLVFSKDNVKL